MHSLIDCGYSRDPQAQKVTQTWAQIRCAICAFVCVLKPSSSFSNSVLLILSILPPRMSMSEEWLNNWNVYRLNALSSFLRSMLPGRVDHLLSRWPVWLAGVWRSVMSSSCSDWGSCWYPAELDMSGRGCAPLYSLCTPTECLLLGQLHALLHSTMD